MLDMPRYLDVCRRNQQMSPIHSCFSMMDQLRANFFGFLEKKRNGYVSMYYIIYHLLSTIYELQHLRQIAGQLDGLKKQQRHTSPENSVRWFTLKVPGLKELWLPPKSTVTYLGFRVPTHAIYPLKNVDLVNFRNPRHPPEFPHLTSSRSQMPSPSLLNFNEERIVGACARQNALQLPFSTNQALDTSPEHSNTSWKKSMAETCYNILPNLYK